MYVDDLNLVGTLEEFTKTAKYLKREFEMKDLGKNKFLSQLTDRAFSKLSVGSSINKY